MVPPFRLRKFLAENNLQNSGTSQGNGSKEWNNTLMLDFLYLVFATTLLKLQHCIVFTDYGEATIVENNSNDQRIS